VLATVARKVPVVAVGHGQAGAHVTGEVKGGNAGTERERREGVPKIVDPPQRADASGTLSRPPLKRAEVVHVEVAAALARKQQRRILTRRQSVERIERSCLQRVGFVNSIRLQIEQTYAGTEFVHPTGLGDYRASFGGLHLGEILKPGPERCKRRRRSARPGPSRLAPIVVDNQERGRPRLTTRFTLASRRSLRRKRLAPHAKLRSP
jgi:hypothetical protein